MLQYTDMTIRPRRNRKNSMIRNAVEEVSVPITSLVQPVFILDPKISQEKQKISSMSNIYRHTIDSIQIEIEEYLCLGLSNIIIFPAVCDSRKDDIGSYSYAFDNFYLSAIHTIKKKFPEINIITDVALDPYSSSGHDGIVKNNTILNDETIEILIKMSLAQSEAGADIIGPSDMMDGRIGRIREALDKNNFQETSIMSYTAKFASHFYSPFRDALGSFPKSGDKKTYQMSYKRKQEAILEAELDFYEGADILMVKPAMLYLDIIQKIKENFCIPTAAYHVSGEYAILKNAIDNNVLPFRAVDETLHSMRRAGADIIITYFAKEYANSIKNVG